MKTSKTSRLARVLVLALVVCMLSCTMLSTVSFAANDEVNNCRNGVLQVNLIYTDDNNEALTVSAGTGFLVNDNTLVTNHHVISLGEEDLQALATLFNKTVVEVKNRLSYQITVTRDVKIPATLINGSYEMDFALLRLSNSIQGKTPLKIRASSSVAQTENVYAIGFPVTSTLLQSYNTYTSDDATITAGVVNKISEGVNLYSGATTQYIQTSCNLDYGNSGGPMVDEDGYVIGVSQGFVGTDATAYYNAVAIDQVTEVLTALNIEYTAAGSETTPDPTQPTDAVPTQPVEDATDAPTQAPTRAPSRNEDEDEDELDIPEPEEDNTMLILIIAGVAVVLVIVIVVVVIAAGGKKKAPAAPAHPAGGMAPPPVRPAAPPVNSGFAPPPTYPMQSAGETTVLSQGAGETTVLSSNHVSGGSLTRKRNGETINITGDQFVIGRERKSVNYCIADNSSISRNHVRLSVRGGVTYLTDLNAANGTFVNGVKVMPRQEIALKSGDKITLADEDFEYRA